MNRYIYDIDIHVYTYIFVMKKVKVQSIASFGMQWVRSRRPSGTPPEIMNLIKMQFIAAQQRDAHQLECKSNITQ